MVEKVGKRRGTKLMFAESDPDKKIVSLAKWRNTIYVATQKGVYRVEGDKLVRLKFVIDEPVET